MVWKPIVAGVDDSPEGAWAGRVGLTIAQQAQTTCNLVHASADASALATLPPTVDPEEFAEHVTRAAYEAVHARLRGSLPPEALANLEIRLGKPARVLQEAVRRVDADLLVVGGKHHAAPARWFGGATAKHLVQVIDVPTIVAVPGGSDVERILVAVDFSEHAGPTIDVARRMATLYGATVRVVHVVEPLPYDFAAQLSQSDEYLRQSEREFQSKMETVLDPSVERRVRRGPATVTLVQEAREWGADLLVVGSHGKGWVDRLLLGSTTQGLLNRLPTSLLVVPKAFGGPTGEVPVRVKDNAVTA